jgi:hypothetical protein
MITRYLFDRDNVVEIIIFTILFVIVVYGFSRYNINNNGDNNGDNINNGDNTDTGDNNGDNINNGDNNGDNINNGDNNGDDDITANTENKEPVKHTYGRQEYCRAKDNQNEAQTNIPIRKRKKHKLFIHKNPLR